MTKGLEEMLTALQITGKQNRIYHGRTQLGVGEHDMVKKRLEEERQKDYQDHMRRKEMERVTKQMGHGEPPTSSPVSDLPTGSVADIGYETSLSIAQQRKQLNDTRRAEYAAHLAAQSAASQTDRHDGSHSYTQTPSAQLQDGCTNTLHVSSPPADTERLEDRRQRQRDYAEALREQIAEKKRNSEQSKKREKEEDKKNIERARGSNKNFVYGSNPQLNSPAEE